MSKSTRWSEDTYRGLVGVLSGDPARMEQVVRSIVDMRIVRTLKRHVKVGLDSRRYRIDRTQIEVVCDAYYAKGQSPVYRAVLGTIEIDRDNQDVLMSMCGKYRAYRQFLGGPGLLEFELEIGRSIDGAYWMADTYDEGTSHYAHVTNLFYMAGRVHGVGVRPDGLRSVLMHFSPDPQRDPVSGIIMNFAASDDGPPDLFAAVFVACLKGSIVAQDTKMDVVGRWLSGKDDRSGIVRV